MKRGVQVTLTAVLACLGVLALLVVGAECFLKEDEAFSLPVGNCLVGIGPWFRTGHGFSQTKRLDVCSSDGTGVTVTLKRRGWLVWTRSRPDDNGARSEIVTKQKGKRKNSL